VSDTSLKQQLTADMKSAMKAKDKQRLTTIRLILSALKQVEVDERIEVDDERLIIILDKMAKQRRESISQYEQAGREDLAEIEQSELDIIKAYLPAALSQQEIAQLVEQAITATSASSMKEMGKVMAMLKPQLQGRADMSQVSQLIKSQLSN